MQTKFTEFDKIKTEGAGFSNPRLKLDKTKTRALADNIADRGLRSPLTIWETDEGLVLVGGHRRYAALELLIKQGRDNGLGDAVPYVQFTGDLQAARLEALADNLDREDLSTFDIATAMDQLVSAGMEQKEIAQKLRRSGPWVSRTLTAFRGAGKDLRKAWKEGALPLETIMDIASLDEEEQVDAISEQKEARGEGGRKEAGKARKEMKKKTDKVERASGKDLQQLLILVEDASTGYVAGMKDALRFALGLIGVGEFADTYQNYVSKKSKTVDVEDDDE